MQFLSFSGDDLNSGGVAYAAHIGGFVSGVILINFMKNKQKVKHRPSRSSVPNSK